MVKTHLAFICQMFIYLTQVFTKLTLEVKYRKGYTCITVLFLVLSLHLFSQILWFGASWILRARICHRELGIQPLHLGRTCLSSGVSLMTRAYLMMFTCLMLVCYLLKHITFKLFSYKTKTKQMKLNNMMTSAVPSSLLSLILLYERSFKKKKKSVRT